MKYLPDLDIEPTPELCEEVCKTPRAGYANIYRPTSNDEPRPYTWMSSRVEAGTGFLLSH